MRVPPLVVTIALVASLSGCHRGARRSSEVCRPESISRVFPDTIELDGRQLHRNGTGTRHFLMLDLYYAALYVERTAHDLATITATDSGWRIQLRMKRAVTQRQAVWSVRQALERSAGERLPELRERFEALYHSLPTTEPCDEFTVSYSPQTGTRVVFRDTLRATIPGRDAANAILSVWLGAQPIEPELRDELLGQPTQ